MLCVIEVLYDVHNLLYEHIQDQVSSAQLPSTIIQHAYIKTLYHN